MDLASAQAYWTDSGPMQKLQATPDCLGLNVPTRSDECELATQHSMNTGLELQSTSTVLPPSGLPTAIRISKLHLFNHADGIARDRRPCSVLSAPVIEHRKDRLIRASYASSLAFFLLDPPCFQEYVFVGCSWPASVYGTKLLCTVYYRRP